jgi:DNA-binding response OmpR family regulator
MRILLVGEDTTYINCLVPEISKRYVVDVAYNSGDGEYMTEINDYDAVIIDGSPNDSMKAVCRTTKVQNGHAPLLMLSDNFDYKNIINALDIGIDLYLPKCAQPEDICRGLQALVNKTNSVEKNIIQIGFIEINLLTKSVTAKKDLIYLRRKEYDILEYLVLNRNKIVSKESLLEHLWASGIYVFSNTVEVHIKHLRDKLEKPYACKLIKTIKGFGYRID